MGAGAPLVVWIGSAAAGTEALGGKATSLDRLARLGFRVPPGFCLTTAAFRDAQSGRDAAVDAALAEALERLVAEVLTIPGAAARFAVRSSAIGEDGATASYAGLHDTELGVSPEDVPEAVRRCWASLWSPAATAYRERRGLDPADAAMAVVVQALVPADQAAVGFTRHPVTGRPDQLVITAVRGLGDAMVSGTVTPDTYTIDRSTRATLELEPGDDPHGPALDDLALAELVELLLTVEAGFSEHVDVEAARAGATWYLLQARPITTGARVPA